MSGAISEPEVKFAKFANLNPDLDEHADEIRRLTRNVIADTIEIGRRLTLCRETLIDHGDWADWLEEKFDWSQSTATNFMRLYNLYETGVLPANFEKLKLPISALYLLAAPNTPAEAAREVIERAERGEKFDGAGVKKVVAKHKPKANGAEPEIIPPKNMVQGVVPNEEHAAKMAALDQPPAAAPLITEPDGGAFDFAKFKKQLAEMAQDFERLSPAQAREVVDLAEPLADGIREIIVKDDKHKRLTKQAKNPQKAQDDDRKQEQRREMDGDRDDAKQEARESGECWSDIKEDWEAEWLLENWDDKREQDFLDEFKNWWRDEHRQEFPASDFAQAKKGGAR